MTRVNPDQSALRAEALRRRRVKSPSERADASRKICRRFLSSRHFLRSQTIGCFLSAWDEVDTGEIIERSWRAKKRIFAPVMRERGQMSFCEILPDTLLTRNAFGLWEPPLDSIAQPDELDIVLTPLVAFDSNRNRIGMGSGYFDRAFAYLRTRNHWHQPKLIGLAFDCQKVEKIVPNPWDIRLYDVICETRWQ
jgi:5-formyltetrahydrofolate cyclo-ligase